MRIHFREDIGAGRFSVLLLRLGSGYYMKITISSELAVLLNNLYDLISNICPNIINIKEKWMDWLAERGIFTWRNDNVTALIDILVKSFEGEEI